MAISQRDSYDFAAISPFRRHVAALIAACLRFYDVLFRHFSQLLAIDATPFRHASTRAFCR
jgi:hypothetical protein